MKEEILKQLENIEKEENIEILFAIESGSRAWGFASSDSDYDVRFVYKRKLKEYLKLEKNRDVIEYMLTDELDINGWDLDKALKLMYRSNPTFFEWCSSPIIYQDNGFLEKINAIKHKYFLIKAGLYHYLNMAITNYRTYLKEDIVKYKKYFYALRPLLACKWILKNSTPPPMQFQDLLFLLPKEVECEVKHLLELKVNSFEANTLHKIMIINNWIENEIEKLTSEIKALPEENKEDMQELNEIFLIELGL